MQTQFDGQLEALLAQRPDELRETLGALRGFGPETVDAILLFVVGASRFPVDVAAQRVLARHGWIDYDADYHAIQETVALAAPDDPTWLIDLRLLVDRVGRDFCGPTPRCRGCPLEGLLPAGGVCQPW